MKRWASAARRGQGSDGWEKDPTAHWLTVRTPHTRVEARASFNRHGGWNREPGVFALGNTLYEDAEGTWRTFTRRGIEDSFYDDDGGQAETLLVAQLKRAEAARERSKANVGKWATVPGAPRRVHQDDLPKSKAALEAGKTWSIMPSGFGTGLQLSSRRLDRYYSSNPAAAKALGLDRVFTTTFDAD